MFTQLDLFGDLPAPEKPSNQPQRTEKKSTAKPGNAGSSVQATQAQLSMGLPDELFPEPSQAWPRQEEPLINEPAEDKQPAPKDQFESTVDRPDQETLSQSASQQITSTEGHPQAEELPFETEQSEVPSDVQNTPGPATFPGDIPTETKAEKGRRYYIQTEIPADPPLAAKPPGPEMLMAGLITSRNTAQEPRPRYIQTEIPSDPTDSLSLPKNPVETVVPIEAEPVAPPGALSIPTTTDVNATQAADEESQGKARLVIPADALRRTRPLMPPKVILADPETEKQEASTDRKTDISEINPQIQKQPLENVPLSGVHEHEKKEKAISSDAISPGVEPIDRPLPDPLPEVEPDVQAGKTAARRKRVVKETLIESIGPGVPPDEKLNARQYYSIGEVASMFSVKASLLRYWESEFDVLKLRKNRKGDRFFRPDDIRSLQLIHHLLKEKKYTIEGAREYMRNAGKMKEKFETIETLQRIRQFLVEMRNGLQIERFQDTQ